MSFLIDLLNPPPVEGTLADHYQFFNDQHSAVSALRYLKNASILTNSNFNTLSAKGTTATTQADGDNTEFIGNWFVVGAANATYTITPTAYPVNSTIKSSSPYYVHVQVSAHNGNAFYFYQRQLATARQYQQEFFTYGLQIKNNQNKAIKIRMDINSFYNPSSSLVQGAPIYLQPGINNFTSTLQTSSLNGVTIGAGNYTEFRFNFINLYNGTADIEIYMIKCEPGQISTPL